MSYMCFIFTVELAKRGLVCNRFGDNVSVGFSRKQVILQDNCNSYLPGIRFLGMRIRNSSITIDCETVFVIPFNVLNFLS